MALIPLLPHARVCRGLAEFDVADVDRHHERRGRRTPVRLTWKYPVLRRDANSRDVRGGRHIVRRRRSTRDVDVVVVPLEKALAIEVERLLGGVRRDAFRERDFKAAPRLTVFLP